MSIIPAGKQLVSWANGKKTYLAIGVGFAVAIAQALGVQIPGWVDFALGLAGLGFHRAAVAQNTQALSAVIQAVEQLATGTESQILVATPQTVSPSSGPRTIQVQTGQTILVGKPSPTTASETDITAALNKAELH